MSYWPKMGGNDILTIINTISGQKTMVQMQNHLIVINLIVEYESDSNKKGVMGHLRYFCTI